MNRFLFPIRADVAVRLATRQYAVASMDYEGHGQSSGRHVYIKDFDNIVDDVVEQADRVKREYTRGTCGTRGTCQVSRARWHATTHTCAAYICLLPGRVEFLGLPCFLYGESMGGAVALQVHRRQTEAWDGAILLAPMCKVGEGAAGVHPQVHGSWLMAHGSWLMAHG